MNQNIKAVLEHLEFHNFTANQELSNDEYLVLDNSLTDRRVSLSSNEHLARFTMLYTFEPNESRLNTDRVNLLNAELSLAKVVASIEGEELFIALNAIYLMPYSKESFNTFWTLVDSDADDFDQVVSESMIDNEE